MARDLISRVAAALVAIIHDVATDPRKLRPGECCRLLNSTPLGPVIDDRRLRGHRERAGNRIGDGKTIDLLRYAGWLAAERHTPRPTVAGGVSPETFDVAAYDQKKIREANRNAAKAAAKAEVGELPPCQDPARRAAAEKSLHAWCQTYLAHWFGLAWSPDLLEVAADVDVVLRQGGRCPRAMPRSGGKSTIGKAACLMAAVTGLHPFIPMVGAIMKHGRRLLADLKFELLFNQLLCQDYPEVCVPIRKVGKVANRCAGQTYRGEPTNIEIAKDHVVLPAIEGSKASGAILMACGLDGAIRGLNWNGQRPTFAFIDDPQTKKSAKSVDQVQYRLDLVKKDIVGWAPPDEALAIFAAVTVIYPGDLADQLLNSELNPDWRGKRYKLLYEFPTKEGLERWKEYGRTRKQLLQAGATDDEAAERLNAFYHEHRAEMDEGAKVGWADRKLPRHVSALQFAMEQFLEDPDYFWNELQNEPKITDGGALFDLQSKHLRGRNNGLPRGTVPIRASHLVAHIDVQHNVLFWTALACDDEIGGSIIDYGTWPRQRLEYYLKREIDPTLGDQLPGATPAVAVKSGLVTLLRHFRNRPWPRPDNSNQAVELVLIDWSDGAMADAVAEICRMPEFLGWAMPAAGKGIGPADAPMHTYRVRTGEKLGHHWLQTRNSKRAVTTITVDANYWKSHAAEALTLPAGNPGAIDFFGDEQTDHRLLADHYTAELGSPLKDERSGRTIVVWKAKPNRDNDHWDNLYNVCAAASIRGCTPAGFAKREKKPRIKLSEIKRNR